MLITTCTRATITTTKHWKKCLHVFTFSILFFSSNAGCGAVINLATYKDHTAECKAKLSKVMFTVHCSPCCFE